MPDSASLSEMVDLALGTPEVGCVNYTVLHRFLHAIIYQLHLENIRADLPDENEKQFMSTVPLSGVQRLRGKKEDAREAGAGAGEMEEEEKVGGDQMGGAYPLSEADSGVTSGVDGSDRPKDTGSDVAIPYNRSPYHQLEEKVERLESLLRDFETLPSNKELLERAAGDAGDRRAADGKPRPVAEMWQSMQLARKVDANTQGVSKLMSLVEDLMLEMQALKQVNSELKAEMERAKENDEKMNEIMRNLQQLSTQMRDLDDRMPTDEVLDGFVSWSTLEDALKGLKLEFDQFTAPPDPPQPPTSKPQEESPKVDQTDRTPLMQQQASDPDLVKTADQMVSQMTSAAEAEVDSTKDQQSRPVSRNRRRSRMSVVGTPSGPSFELVDLLERLGKLTSQHEELEARVDLLEIEMQKKGDMELLRSLGFSEGLNDQLRKILEDIDGLRDKQTQDVQSLDQLQKLADSFQLNLDKLNSSVVNLSEDSFRHNNQLEDLQNNCRELDERKADKDFVLSEVDLKADKEKMDGKVNSSEFETTCDEINHMINDILNKLMGSQGDWKNALDQLNNDLDGKVDRLEFAPHREELEKQLRALAKKIAALQSQGDRGVMDEAAGIRRQLIQRFHCISCDRPLDIIPQKAVPSLPAVPGLPEAKSNRPYMVYELDQIRQQKRNYGWAPQYTEVVDLYATSRACGGSHTMTFPHRRLVRSSNPGPGIYADEGTPPQQPPPPYRSDTEVANFSRGNRVTSAALLGSNQTSAAATSSRLPNVYPQTNRSSVGKPSRAFAEPDRPPSPLSNRPTSAQLSLRPLSTRNEGLLLGQRSKTTAPPGDELRSQKTPTPPSQPRNGFVADQMPQVRVPAASHPVPDDGVANAGGSASTFQEIVPEGGVLVDEADN